LAFECNTTTFEIGCWYFDKVVTQAVDMRNLELIDNTDTAII